MDAVNNILTKLELLVVLSPIEKYNSLIQIANDIKSIKNEVQEEKFVVLCSEILKHIVSLRYGFAFNKATESNTGTLDRVLAGLALEFARLSHSKKLTDYIKDVLYYEDDQNKREKYLSEIDKEKNLE